MIYAVLAAGAVAVVVLITKGKRNKKCVHCAELIPGNMIICPHCRSHLPSR